MPDKKTYEELQNRILELEALLKGGSNREYKSRLFSFLFGREENKKWTLSLYNAIHGSSHNDVSDITINTMEDVVYMGIKNDLSILVSETVSLYRSIELYEQQSSYNPNMPVREFMYAGKLYDQFIHSTKLNRYGRKLLPLPLPKLIVFYNGEDDKADETILCLSHAFKEEIRRNVVRRHTKMNEKTDEHRIMSEVNQIFQEADPDIEVKVRMININYGHNQTILSACRPLAEYAWFVAQTRNNLSTGSEQTNPMQMGIRDAIDKAINEMPEAFEIKKFIMANRSEVKDMCLTEYNEAETMEMLLQEGRQEGLQKGRQEGRQETMIRNLKNLMDSTGWTAEKAMDTLKIPPEQRSTLSLDLSITSNTK